jgi:hypothetical protein
VYDYTANAARLNLDGSGNLTVFQSATVSGGLNVGTATGAATGEIHGSGWVISRGAGGAPVTTFVGMAWDGANSRGLVTAGTGTGGGGFTYSQLHLEGSEVRIKYQTSVRINVNSTGIGFFNATPVAQQTGGAATAGGTYTGVEQTMLNRVYTAMRNFGLIT